MALNNLSWLLQIEEQTYVKEKLGRELWITVFQLSHSEGHDIAYFCALIPKNKENEVVSDPSWEFLIGSGLPGHSMYQNNGVETIEYHRFGNDDGFEPLVLVRDFYGAKPSYPEVSEEFRLLHNLFFDQQSSTFIKINENGDDEEVVRISNSQVQIRNQELRQFLAIKEMALTLYFEVTKFSEIELNQIPVDERNKELRTADICYDFFVDNTQFSNYQTLSRLLGKKLVYGLSKEKSGIWPYTIKKEFLNFTIGVDDDFQKVEYTSDPDQLSNYFGANPGAPHYLTPVFFRSEVLGKYYNNPQKYTIEDGHLTCNGIWSVRIDNHIEKYVVVFLGDLGRDLPAVEQKYWQSFNVIPDGKISDVNFRRSFLGQFADPEKADLLFKYRFENFQKTWKNKFGWQLFSPLHKDEEHLFKALHIPLTNDQAEFDGQVLALTKILIEYLNEDELKRLTKNIPNGARGITKLECFLGERGFQSCADGIILLRNLWDIRSEGIGHRKGSNYEKTAKKFAIGDKKFPVIFRDILFAIVDFLDNIEQQLTSVSNEK